MGKPGQVGSWELARIYESDFIHTLIASLGSAILQYNYLRLYVCNLLTAVYISPVKYLIYIRVQTVPADGPCVRATRHDVRTMHGHFLSLWRPKKPVPDSRWTVPDMVRLSTSVYWYLYLQYCTLYTHTQSTIMWDDRLDLLLLYYHMHGENAAAQSCRNSLRVQGPCQAPKPAIPHLSPFPNV